MKLKITLIILAVFLVLPVASSTTNLSLDYLYNATRLDSMAVNSRRNYNQKGDIK